MLHLRPWSQYIIHTEWYGENIFQLFHIYWIECGMNSGRLEVTLYMHRVSLLICSVHHQKKITAQFNGSDYFHKITCQHCAKQNKMASWKNFTDAVNLNLSLFNIELTALLQQNRDWFWKIWNKLTTWQKRKILISWVICASFKKNK